MLAAGWAPVRGGIGTLAIQHSCNVKSNPLISFQLKVLSLFSRDSQIMKTPICATHFFPEIHSLYDETKDEAF
jgi:hypothetical protein